MLRHQGAVSAALSLRLYAQLMRDAEDGNAEIS